MLLIVLKKNFFKLMINYVYGKIMENLRKKFFDKNYAAIHKIKSVLTLRKPIYVGFTVLELIKWLMYGSITTLLKNILMLNCYFHTQIVLLMK